MGDDMSLAQLNCWFLNMRKRHFIPVVKRGRAPRGEFEAALLAHGARLDKKGDAAKAAKKNKKQDASKIATRR
ncbi:hypothetical protein M885DRAFT_509189 [Pelagophyceae sp. CCMP2097]|nr:hypothetical protein M885DRAFT_509189 [Pelagophyceae sp. CCMP2097]